MRLRVDLEAAVSTRRRIAWAPTELVDQDGQPLGCCPGACCAGSRRRPRPRAGNPGGHGDRVRRIRRAAGASPGAGGPPMASPRSSSTPRSSTTCTGTSIRPGSRSSSFMPNTVRVRSSCRSPRRRRCRRPMRMSWLGSSCAAPGDDTGFACPSLPVPCRGRRKRSARPSVVRPSAGAPLLSGGTGPHGLTDRGGSIVGGFVRWLPEVIGVLAPSLLSGLRLQPDHWSGAFACWGLENREAAVRLCAATAGIRRGAKRRGEVYRPPRRIRTSSTPSWSASPGRRWTERVRCRRRPRATRARCRTTPAPGAKVVRSNPNQSGDARCSRAVQGRSGDPGQDRARGAPRRSAARGGNGQGGVGRGAGRAVPVHLVGLRYA